MKFLGKTPLQRRRQAGRRGAEIHRGKVDGHPHHRRHRDLRGRSLRARQGTRTIGRRLHRPCRRLRPDRRRGQGSRLPRREHRRQISAGVGRFGPQGSVDGDGRCAGGATACAACCRRTRACAGARAGKARIQLHPRSRDGSGRRAAEGRRQRVGDLQGERRRHARRVCHDRLQQLQDVARTRRLCR